MKKLGLLKKMKLIRFISHQKQQKSTLGESGFTIVELALVMLIIGILSAIVAPGWLGFVNRQRLRNSTDRVYNAMQKAQNLAKRDKKTWQASFKNNGDTAQWAFHRPDEVPPETQKGSQSDQTARDHWYELEEKIEIDTDADYTNMEIEKDDNNNDIYKIEFNYKGCPVGQDREQCTQTSLTFPQKLTLKNNNGDQTRRCVLVQTQLGAMRIAEGDECQG